MVKMAIYTQKCEQKWLKINNGGGGGGENVLGGKKNRQMNNRGGWWLLGTREYYNCAEVYANIVRKEKSVRILLHLQEK